MPELSRTQAEDLYLQPVAHDKESGHGIGYKYRPARRGGSIFAVIRSTWHGYKIISEGHPATEKGWRSAWREFVAINPTAANKAREELNRQGEEKGDRLERIQQRRTLEQSTLALLGGAVFLGGYTPHAELTEGASYDLRFLADNLGIFAPRKIEARAELPYDGFSNVQIGGPGLVRSVSPLVAPAEKIAGAAIRFAQPNSNVNLLAAEDSAISAALRAAGTRRKIQTVLLIQAVDSELFFSSTDIEPDQLRINLSRGLGRIRDILESTTADQQANQNNDFSSTISQLEKAAALLDRGLLTREEFQQLKSRLIAGS